MGKRVDPRSRIKQISVGFKQRQIDFIDKNYKDINVNLICQDALDEQIKLLNEIEFLDVKE